MTGWGIAAAGVGAAVAIVALRIGRQGVSGSVDTVQYHAVNAGTWLHADSLVRLPAADPGFPTTAYPSNHTLTGLWLMLAARGDQLVYVVNVAWAALAVRAGGRADTAAGWRSRRWRSRWSSPRSRSAPSPTR